jgi:hypothetical protein
LSSSSPLGISPDFLSQRLNNWDRDKGTEERSWTLSYLKDFLREQGIVPVSSIAPSKPPATPPSCQMLSLIDALKSMPYDDLVLSKAGSSVSVSLRSVATAEKKLTSGAETITRTMTPLSSMTDSTEALHSQEQPPAPNLKVDSPKDALTALSGDELIVLFQSLQILLTSEQLRARLSPDELLTAKSLPGRLLYQLTALHSLLSKNPSDGPRPAA